MRGVVVALILVLFLAAGLVLVRKKSSATLTCPWPGGGEFVLTQVSYGKVHRYHGTLREQLLGWLPPGLARRFNISAPTLTTDEPSLCLWLIDRRPPNPLASSRLEITLSDEAGVESESNAARTSFSGSSSPIEGQAFTAFPRRGKLIRINLYERNARWLLQKVGTFTIANPAPRDFPAWTPDPPGHRHRAGHLEARLLDLKVGLNQEQSAEHFATNLAQEGWARASFVLLDHGLTVSNWAPAAIELSDATGNRIAANSWSNWEKNDRQIMAFRWWLWSGEPAWKAHVEFSEKSGFKTNDLWTATITAPDESGLTETNLAMTLHGASVLLRGVAGPGVAPSWKSYSNLGPSSVLRVETQSLPPDCRLTLAEVRDDRGNILSLGGASYGDGKFDFALLVPAGAKQLQVTLAVHQSVYADFLVKPEFPPRH